MIVPSQAKSILGEMRVRCNAIKQELESNIQLYKDSVKHSRTVEKQIQVKTLTMIKRNNRRGLQLYFTNVYQYAMFVVSVKPPNSL